MRHIPNILSVFRISLIPFFIWQMLEDNLLNAGILLAISGVTDVLDGFLARHFGWVSSLGKVLDPVADKLTQVVVCVLLCVRFPQYWYFFAFLVFKEMLMLTLGGWLVRRHVRFESSRWFGKVVTVSFYVVMAALIFFPAIPGWVQLVLLCVVSLCALGAGLMYIPQFITYRRSAAGQKAPSSGAQTPAV